MSVNIASYLSVAAILFCLGLYGVLTKRNAVIVLLSLELMLNAVNLNLVAFAKYGLYPALEGQVFTLFIMAISAAEASVGLAILIALFRNRGTSEVPEMDELKG